MTRLNRMTFKRKLALLQDDLKETSNSKQIEELKQYIAAVEKEIADGKGDQEIPTRWKWRYYDQGRRL